MSKPGRLHRLGGRGAFAVSTLLAAGSALGADVTADVGLGSGKFQDIQVPMHELAGRRSDGTFSESENINRVGIPITAVLSITGAPSVWSHRMDLRILEMTQFIAAPNTTKAGYGRVDLGFGGDSTVFTKGSIPFVSYLRAGGDLLYARSAYKVGAFAHIVETLMPGARLEIGSKDSWSLAGTIHASVLGRTSYDGGKGLFHDTIEGSKTSSNRVNTTLRKTVYEGVALFAAMDIENTRITIDSVEAYEGFGLTVETSDRLDRDYILQTQTFTFGVSRKF